MTRELGLVLFLSVAAQGCGENSIEIPKTPVKIDSSAESSNQGGEPSTSASSLPKGRLENLK